MQRLEVSGAVRAIYVSLGVKGLIPRGLSFRKIFHCVKNNSRLSIIIAGVSFTFRKPGRRKLLLSGTKPLHVP